MNFLFHMLLSGDDSQLLLGNFMGDFVKGPLPAHYVPRIRHGIYLHRRIDSHVEQHPVYRRSRQRLDPAYGLYRGIMLDLFYDYFLVNNWSAWHSEPLPEYLQRTREIIEENVAVLPAELQRLLPMIFDELLPSYGTVTGIGIALGRISRRLKRANPLAGSEAELLRHHAELHKDFMLLTPQLFSFAAEIAAPPHLSTTPSARTA
jgi:acyl carrier protein phosphodiesterase